MQYFVGEHDGGSSEADPPYVLAVYLVLLFSGPDVDTTRGLTIQTLGQKIVVYTGIICVVIQSYGAYQVERRRLAQGGEG